MKADERERFADELLEYLYDCHPDPTEIEGRLAEDGELRALLEEVRAEKGLLDEAARAPKIELDLPEPPALAAVPERPVSSTTSSWGWLRAAVVLLPIAALSAAGGNWAWRWMQMRSAYGDALQVVVSGPSGVPDGAETNLSVETFGYERDLVDAELAWTAFDEAGQELSRGTERSDGRFQLALPADLTGVRRVEVVASRGTSESAASFQLSPTADNPLVHLTTDKPAYRPGEIVRFRGTFLNRLSLDAREGSARLRLIDGKDAPVTSWVASLEEGVAAGEWLIPEGTSGGRFHLEVRDGEDQFTVERVPFLVRDYQPPQLAKTIELDRETYAPGESGRADVRIERVEGGFAAGARLDASLILDGEVVWNDTRAADALGRSRFAFEVPNDVEEGAARFVCRVQDGGVIETQVEPFVVPTGKLEVAFYPEGGELVAGMRGRVYAEVTDPLGRPASARGRVVSGDGRTVARFDTEHQGRGRFEFEPELGETYELEFDEPSAPAVGLPEVRPAGVALRAIGEGYDPGAPVRLNVTTADDGPWIAALFCRGVLVSQGTFSGTGEHQLSLDVPSEVAGVLRATVFDRALLPLAERLVHRRSGRSIELSVEARDEALLPGANQELLISAKDETGRPVAALVGVAVTDRAVRDLVGDARIGLADQARLAGDVEELEDVEEFLGGTGSARNVDLLLGTRGWRRFGWFRSDELIADHGDQAKRVLLLEGRSDVPRVRGGETAATASVGTARKAERKAKDIGILVAIGCLIFWAAVLLGGFVRSRVDGIRPVILWPVAGLSAAAMGILVVAVLTGGMNRESAGVAARLFADAPAAMAVDFELEPEPILKDAELLGLEALGYGGGEGRVALGYVGAAAAEVRRFNRPPEAAVPDFFQDDDGGDAADEVMEEPELDFDALGKLGYVANERQGLRRADVPSVRYARIYAHQNERAANQPRTDFTETVYWNPTLRLPANGERRVRFDVSDRVTTWSVVLDAHGDGRVGQALASFTAVQPFRMEAKLPFELTAGDQIQIPIALTSGGTNVDEASWEASVSEPFVLAGNRRGVANLVDGRGRVLVPIDVPADAGHLDGLKLAFSGEARGWKDAVERSVRVVPRGFPQHISEGGRVDGVTEFSIGVPEDPVAGSMSARLVLYPSPLADLLDGLDGMLRTPSGCFEQASSTNYPNVLVLAYLEAAAADEPAAVARARELMSTGYDKIVGYECSERGYEWFGGNPGHEALTAYGLLEFADMARVFDVNADMVARTREWLLDRRDGSGGYQRNERALDSFGRAPAEVTDAYCTYALACTVQDPLDVELLASELDALERSGMESDDPYVVALAAAAMQAVGRSEQADAMRERLKLMQDEDGGLRGATKSITSSGGDDLAVETTSLAILAWLDDEGDAAQIERAVEFVLSKRRSGGTFGATQATIQAMRALVGYAEANRRVANAGEVVISIDDYEVRRVPVEAGQRGAIELADLASELTPGTHNVRIEVTGGNVFPWAFDLEYFAELPADDPEAPVEIETRLAAESVAEGSTVALEVVVRNRTEEGQPMTLAVIGIPAGLEIPTEVLDDLREAGRFDLWEIRGREVVLYWRDLAPSEEKRVSLDLIGRILGTTYGPASRVFLYYTSATKQWAPPLVVRVGSKFRRR